MDEPLSMASPASLTEEFVAQILLSLIPRTLLCDFQILLWGSQWCPNPRQEWSVKETFLCILLILAA